jgi:aspartate 1-decarboxylase
VRHGAAAHVIGKGEQIIVMGFELTASLVEPQVVLVDQKNRFLRYLAEAPITTFGEYLP